MADNILFKSGLASKLNDITKVAGQLLFAIDGTSGSIYLDKDTNTRIKMNLDATKLQNAINIKINGIANAPIETANLDGTQNVSLNIPTTVTNFTKVESDTFVVNDKVTLRYNPTNECLEFVFA